MSKMMNAILAGEKKSMLGRSIVAAVLMMPIVAQADEHHCEWQIIASNYVKTCDAGVAAPCTSKEIYITTYLNYTQFNSCTGTTENHVIVTERACLPATHFSEYGGSKCGADNTAVSN